MRGGHALGHRGGLSHLHVPGTSPLHRLAPEAKLAGLLGFVVAVALTPRHAVVAFAAHAVVLLVVVALSRLRPRLVLVRLTAIVPFVAFALFVPFIATGEQVTVLGVSVSEDGLWATWNIVAKATIGATAGIVMAATTPVPDILHGLTRLRVPRVMVGIIAFMFRYLDLLADQLGRMRQAMVARCHDPRWLWQARPIAASAGALFVRSYERGERIHQAMLARGFTGSMPDLDDRHATAGDWLAALAPAALATIALVVAVVG